MEKPTVAITIRNFDLQGGAMVELLSHLRPVYTNTTGRRLTEADLTGALGEAEIAIAGTEPFTREVIESAPRLRIISRVGTGTDSVDLGAARKKGVRVLTTAEAPVQAVAEHTLALILAVMKGIPLYNEGARKGDLSTRPGRLLSGSRAGIVGLGRIGTTVAAILEPLGCSVSYYDPFIGGTPARAWKRAGSLVELVREVDILSLHAPAQLGDRALITGEVFSACKRGIIIINTARGSLINEEAMITALRDGTVAGAGLDVLPRDPYDGPLLSFLQVIVTPHVASNTVETRARMEVEAVRRAVEAITGGRL
jgi:D-3-phosphoglycerate dehydrogenase